MSHPIKRLVLAVAAAVLAAAGPAHADVDLSTPWPSGAALNGFDGETIRFSSHSPFTIAGMPPGENSTPATEAEGRLFLPDGASAASPAPAVILLHGASGVRHAREITYARQFAARGVAALVIDVFGARRDMARGFVDRLVNITEAMFLADAYAGLHYLAERPEVDGGRVVLIGFSYGGMAATYAAHEQVRERFAQARERFAGHVAFYAPCIVRFADERATGAPVLMLYGGRDAIIDPERCRQTAEALERGGSAVRTIVYENAVHQWDGNFPGPRPIGRDLSDCLFLVTENGQVWGTHLPVPMANPLTRKLLLGTCAGSEGYLIGRDDAVRARSNRDLAGFLERAFGLR